MPRHLTVQDLYTYENGLTLNGGIVKLGGDLTGATNIGLNGSTFKLSKDANNYFSFNDRWFDYEVLDTSDNWTLWFTSSWSGFDMYTYNGSTNSARMELLNGSFAYGGFTLSDTSNASNKYAALFARAGDDANYHYTKVGVSHGNTHISNFTRRTGHEMVVSTDNEVTYKGLRIDTIGAVKIDSLSGADTRMVVVTSGGTLSTQTIPSGTASRFGVVGEDASASADRSFDWNMNSMSWSEMDYFSISTLGTSRQTYFESGPGYADWWSQNTVTGKLVGLTLDPNSATQKAELYATGTKVTLNATTAKIHLESTNGVVVSTLAGTGTRMVVADANGLISTQSVAKAYTPTSTADVTGAAGDIAYDDSYIYVKTSAGWKRSTLSTF